MEMNKILEQLNQYVKDECTNEDDECTKLEYVCPPPIDVLFAHRKNPYNTKSELKENIEEFYKTCELYKEELEDDTIVCVFSLLSLIKTEKRNVKTRADIFLALVEYVLNTYA
jgi:hypothetical protein